jgi:3-deoxy-manno-octulosonate cytidylyltransferase (CMP-KDO synthetase)
MALPSSGNTLVVIPARMASTRLPGKPLADICGTPMIVHVLHRAQEAALGPVIVACADEEIARAVEAAGGHAVMTDPDLPSGSDRVFAALRIADPEGRIDYVVNLQGDLPTVAPEIIRAAIRPLADPAVDIGTPVAFTCSVEEEDSESVVKAVADLPSGATTARATGFVRRMPAGAPPPYLHHIGIYAYRREALERFVSLPESPSEREHRLEQLRALDAGMRIDVALVDSSPFGVDTPADLERARSVIAATRA